MKYTVTLDEDDIKKAVAKSYQVDECKVKLITKREAVGQGLNEHDINKIYIDIDYEDKMAEFESIIENRISERFGSQFKQGE